MAEYIFKPSNVLTFETVQADTLRLNKLLSNRELTGIRMNLSDVTHCDSTGLALLIEAKRLCKHQNISFAMDNMSDSLIGLAKFCELDVVLL